VRFVFIASISGAPSRHVAEILEQRLNRLIYLQSDFDNYRKWSEKEKGARRHITSPGQETM
jgi:hypothetical protein